MCRSEVHFRPANDTATDSYQRLLTRFVSADDEHDVLETRRELEKNCASRWSFTKNQNYGLFQIPCGGTAVVQQRNFLTTEVYYVLFGQSVGIPWGKGRIS